MAGETNIQLVKVASNAASRARTSTPQQDVARNHTDHDLSEQNAPAHNNANTQQTAELERSSVDVEDVNEFVQKIENSVQNVQRNLRFSVDSDSGETIIKVFDSQTDQLIRQIPSEELIKMRERMQEFKGTLFDDTV